MYEVGEAVELKRGTLGVIVGLIDGETVKFRAHHTRKVFPVLVSEIYRKALDSDKRLYGIKGL